MPAMLSDWLGIGTALLIVAVGAGVGCYLVTWQFRGYRSFGDQMVRGFRRTGLVLMGLGVLALLACALIGFVVQSLGSSPLTG